jgi:hypothetical protein
MVVDSKGSLKSSRLKLDAFGEFSGRVKLRTSKNDIPGRGLRQNLILELIWRPENDLVQE